MHPQPTEPRVATEPQQQRRLVIISNREPYTVTVNDEVIHLEKTPGGLISALDPVLKKNGGLWICWEGATRRVEELDDTPTLSDLTELQHISLPYDIRTVALTQNEINHYYYGYANARLWPLLHSFPSRCDFMDERDWPNYESANQKFAAVAVEHTTDDDLIWVQDYQLFLVPGFIRQRASQRKIGFFCHIPFPHFEMYRLLPRRDTLLKGLLGADLIGFHIPTYVQYFLESVERLLPEARVDFQHRSVHYQGRVIQVQDFPISIDFRQIADLTNQPDIQKEAQQLRESYGGGQLLGIGLDRLDYTKGILERLEAIRCFFIKYPEHKKRLTFVQIAAPTRTEVDMYRQMKEQIDQAVGRINGELSEDGWMPIQYFYRNFTLREILPYFLAADFALITPLRDGMNLVAKEYCAAKLGNHGMVILSELTGAAYELTEMVQVNPYFVEEVADAIHQTLQMPTEIKTERMRATRKYIQENDIHAWVKHFIQSFELAVST
jgi:trehalose 6-phosphate synthase/phosphatase